MYSVQMLLIVMTPLAGITGMSSIDPELGTCRMTAHYQPSHSYVDDRASLNMSQTSA